MGSKICSQLICILSAHFQLEIKMPQLGSTRLGKFSARARSSRKIPARTHLYKSCILSWWRLRESKGPPPHGYSSQNLKAANTYGKNTEQLSGSGLIRFPVRKQRSLRNSPISIELMINKLHGGRVLWWLSVSLWRICIIFFDQVNVLHR